MPARSHPLALKILAMSFSLICVLAAVRLHKRTRGCKWGLKTGIANDLQLIKANQVLMDQARHYASATLQAHDKARYWMVRWKASMQEKLATGRAIRKAMNKACAELWSLPTCKLHLFRDKANRDLLVAGLQP
mmetsp:Transcript_62373/g.148732  ORF Transcript_62373/g.148732 Transcript_62373/m.148732 type:complete len:133 (-) Transcript_62373:1574-1972(-)